VRAHAESNLSFEETTRFRLRAYGPKGKQPLVSVCFAVKNLAWDADEAPSRMSPAPVPPATTTQAPIRDLPRIETKEGIFAPYRALGQYYEQFGQVLANGYGQLQNINTAMITGLYDQIRQSHHHRDTLVTSVVRLRTEQIEKAESRDRQEHSESERNALARQALQQLGEATKAVFVSQGISPEHLEVLDSLTASPELMATLRDPRVRQLMRDPNNLRALAGLLGQIAIQQHQAAMAAPQQHAMMPGGPAPQAMMPGAPGPYAMPPGAPGPQAMPPGAPGPQAIPAGYAPQGSLAPGQAYPVGAPEPPPGGAPGGQQAA
jgi:hypothetical protein